MNDETFQRPVIYSRNKLHIHKYYIYIYEWRRGAGQGRAVAVHRAGDNFQQTSNDAIFPGFGAAPDSARRDALAGKQTKWKKNSTNDQTPVGTSHGVNSES